jgi:hypothetical protein
LDYPDSAKLDGQHPMTKKSFLDRAAEFTYQELERRGNDPAKLDVAQYTVAILYSLQAIIDNGGFQYFFESDLPYLLPYAAVCDAYRRIGATQAAERLNKAVSMFPFPNPEIHQEKRLKFMESLEEHNEFFELGDEVCGDETVWLSLEEYAKKNAASFRVM